MELLIVIVMTVVAVWIISSVNSEEINHREHCGTTRHLKEFHHGVREPYTSHYVCEKCIAEGKPVSWGKINNWFGY